MDIHSTNIWMYISSFSEEVTGSNTYVQVNWSDGREVKFVIDCGLFQESKWNSLNLEKFAYKPENIDFAIITHFHTDHVGRFPYLVNEGFKGKIYITNKSKCMFPKMLNLTAEILEDQYERNMDKWKAKRDKKKLEKNCRGKRDRLDGKVKKKKYIEFVDKSVLRNKPKLIFTKDDVMKTQSRVVAMNMEETFSPAPDVYVTFYPNGHLLGAAVIVITVKYENEKLTLLVTGDYAKKNKVTGEESYVPQHVLDSVDVVISESTYGAAPEVRDTTDDYNTHVKILEETFAENRHLVYMVNAIERPLTVLRELQYIMENESIGKKLAEQPIYFDSTFGMVGLHVYEKILGAEKLNLPENLQLINSDNRDLVFSKLQKKQPLILMITSPQFYDGAISMYIDKILPDSNTNMLFASYVPENVSNVIRLPRGSQIEYKGVPVVKNCTMTKVGHFSSHASVSELAELIDRCRNKNTILFLHGQSVAKDNMVERFATEKITTYAMLKGKTVRINKHGITKVY